MSGWLTLRRGLLGKRSGREFEAGYKLGIDIDNARATHGEAGYFERGEQAIFQTTMKSCGTVRTGVPWRMRLGKWRAGIRRSFVCCCNASPVVVVLFLLGLGIFLPSLKAEQEAESATVLVEEGRPDLIVHFSSFINTNRRTFFILNAKNIGSRPAAVRQKLNGEGVCSVHTAATMTTALCTTNAGWTVIPAGQSRRYHLIQDGAWPFGRTA